MPGIRPCSLQRYVAAAAAALACCAVFAQPPAYVPPAARIVVVPDVHGAFTELAGLLRATGLVDDALNWRGGDARLVSLGDLLDRGPESRRVLDLLMRLEQEAASTGGGVHVLLGNHEVMNLVGDLRYVSPEEYAAFASDEPDAVRAAAFERFRRAYGDAAQREAQDAFEQRYPRGYFAHRRAFAADGRYGRWLLSLQTLLVIGDTAFVHGGLPPLVAEQSADELNRRVGEKLRRYLELRAELADAGVLPADDMQQDIERAQAAREHASAEVQIVLDAFLAEAGAPELGPDGPLWYRGSVYCSPLLEAPVLDAALGRLGASRVVVGHTPTEDRRARSLHDGRLIALDTGMLTSRYAGRPAALVIEGERRSVHYLEPSERLALADGAVVAYGLTEPELLAALREGELEPRGDGPLDDDSRGVTVTFGGTALDGRFFGDRAAAGRELAAHRLDRLLGLQLVPATVERRWRNRNGALQLIYPRTVSESERLARRAALGEGCPLPAQIAALHAFDLLTLNTGRSADTVLYHVERARVVSTGHGRAFGSQRLPPGERLEWPAALRTALAALDRQTLSNELGAWLDRAQLGALLARRDQLLDRARD